MVEDKLGIREHLNLWMAGFCISQAGLLGSGMEFAYVTCCFDQETVKEGMGNRSLEKVRYGLDGWILSTSERFTQVWEDLRIPPVVLIKEECDEGTVRNRLP